MGRDFLPLSLALQPLNGNRQNRTRHSVESWSFQWLTFLS
jgi:hypothetical protein